MIKSPMTSPVKSHSTFPTKDRLDSMYSPSNVNFDKRGDQYCLGF